MGKKLIEVALPLDDVNAASAREKSVRHGHPSTLHLWWSRKPLAVARTVIFSQMVDDPSEYVVELRADAGAVAAAERELARRGDVAAAGASAGENVEAAGASLDDVLVDLERQRLFEIIRELVKWENTANERVLECAREEIRRSWRRTCETNADHPRAAELFDPNKLPAFHDPFAGGGALPLEAQRLGLEAHASDLNPVAVLINKAMIEIPPKFADKPPVNPDADAADDYGGSKWKGAMGLADDVRYYGQWMRDEAEKRIGHLYPKVAITPEMVKARPDLKQYEGRELTVIAWLWARTVKSPNPAFADVDVPLASTFMLSTKKGKEAYVEPVIEGKGYRLKVKTGAPPDAAMAKSGTKLSRGANFKCLMSGIPIGGDYIKSEGMNGRMGARLLALVVEGERGRVYLTPQVNYEDIASKTTATWKPDQLLPDDKRNFWTVQYGLKSFGDLFTNRQLVALTTFSDLVGEAITRVRRDAVEFGLPDDSQPLRDGGASATAYAEAVALYLAFGVDKAADRNSTICGWVGLREHARNTFSMQAIPMVWDFAETNLFSDSSGNFFGGILSISSALINIPAKVSGRSSQCDSKNSAVLPESVVSTDPPYYDNIGYADLSDYFYVWLRRPLRSVFPTLFSTLAVPKSEELVATPYRHGGKEAAELFFLNGMERAIVNLANHANKNFPITIYYAFKQSELRLETGVSSTGWETFLDALIQAGLRVSGTWPMRTERSARSTGIGTNALASSIVLVCSRRPSDAPTVSRRDFVTRLRTELPPAISDLQRGNIAPVDLAQAAIGPGMSVYTRYALLFALVYLLGYSLIFWHCQVTSHY